MTSDQAIILLAFLLGGPLLFLVIIFVLPSFVKDVEKELNKPHCDRRTRINAKAPEHPMMFAPGVSLQLNADGTLPEWIQIAPFGEHPTRDKRAVQRFNAEAADQVISWFNFWPRRIARLANLNAIKVWVGHPDFAPTEWPERIDLGSVVELKADDKGLNARIEWNADAMAHVTKNKFPSVAWDCDVISDGVEVPAMLWSVGMTNRPNIKSVHPVINAAGEMDGEEMDAEDPQEESAPESAPATNLMAKVKALLIQAGLVKESDSDDALLSGVSSMISSIVWKREEEARRKTELETIRTALNAVADVADAPDTALPEMLITQLNATVSERATLTERINALTTDLAHERAERINAIVERALETGRINKAGEEALRTQLNADLTKGLEEMLARPVQLNTKPLSIGSCKPAIMEAAERATRLNAWLDDYQQKNQCDRQAAWTASEADPQMKSIHEAMKAADQARTASVE